MSKPIKITIPDNFHAVLSQICENSSETIAEYCSRAVINKIEHDLMVKLPDKWKAFTEKPLE